MMLTLIVFCRIIANPVSNVFQKLLTLRHADPLFVIFATHAGLSIICLPFLLVLQPHLPATFLLNMIGVAILTVSGNALLVQAVKLSDLSLLGPVNAYKSIISLVPGMILLHEFPRGMGLTGMGLIVAGSYFVVDKAVDQPKRNVFVRFFTDRGVQYRFAAMALSATEAVFLKKAVLESGAWVTFACWAVFGFAAALLTVAVLLRNRLRGELRVARDALPTYLSLVLTTGLMQFCTILVLHGFQVGYALALFQTSTLISVLLGCKLFKERNIVERLIGSVVMIAGAVLIVLRGG
jgi:drug/metabolite transporter (DMT)-like permease